MMAVLMALSVFLGSPLAALQQEGWSETSFHRIYLRNGNFIDGKVISDKPAEVIVLLKSGEMGIKRDQIDRVELVKMRSFNEKPLVLETPKTAAKTPPKDPSTSTATPQVDTPEAIRKKVDLILFKYKNTRKSADDELPAREIGALGEEAVVYLASVAPKFDLQSQEAIAAALVVLKPTPKVIEVLKQLLTHENPRSRGLALSVLCAGASESDKATYAVPLLRDSDLRVRQVALSSIGSTDDKGLFPTIVDFCADPEKDVRARAIQIAKNLAEKHGLKEELARAMASNLSNSNPGVRVDAASALGFLAMAVYWKDLSTALSDGDPTVRAAAAQALMGLAVPESSEAIAVAIGKEDDHWARVYLAGAVQRLKVMAAVDTLIRWLSDSDEEIKKLGATTLQGITGQTFGLDRDRWQSWWAANRR